MKTPKQQASQMLKTEIEKLDKDIKNLTARYNRVKFLDNMDEEMIKKLYAQVASEETEYSRQLDYQKQLDQSWAPTGKMIRSGIMYATVLVSTSISSTWCANLFLGNIPLNIDNVWGCMALPITMAGWGIYHVGKSVKTWAKEKHGAGKLDKLQTNMIDLGKALSLKKEGKLFTKVIAEEINQKNIEKQTALRRLREINSARSLKLEPSLEQN